MKNNWLVGNKAYSFKFINKYWQVQKQTTSKDLLPFLTKNSLFLTCSECKELKKLTFLSPELPFGKIDKDCVLGMVSDNKNQIDLFENEIRSALKLIELVPEIHSLLIQTIKCFVPIEEATSDRPLRKNGSGNSSHWMKGAVFLSLPEKNQVSRIELASNIVHELGHQIFMIYQDCDPILFDLKVPIYSAIRKTTRPAIMSFHALIAIHFMLFLLSKFAELSNWNTTERKYIDLKLKQLRSDFIGGANAIRNLKFTPLGLVIFQEMVEYCTTSKATA